MQKADYLRYIDCFNRGDFAGFSCFYADDVVLELGTKARLEGRAAIVAFYRQNKDRVRETLRVDNLIIDDTGIAAELDTQFLALQDWPDFIAGPLRQGDTLHIVSLVHYRLLDGLFSHIKSARCATLS
ncbi:SnoaL-like domain-containing protein [Pseudomonas capeferrum]|uniref:nuclear transport factor 2 family protein n=1 Tax=Pseudomonas capeferrum TaxID=1495066 RepID=UPI0015E35AC6|nr:nuclear transport factor 2 family protein [Pseudomonas capeferrum]MBA1204829.1 SnoaL-like domain-containing protein [Pseudomonas capeferrum]